MKPLQVQRPKRNPNPEVVFYRRGGQAYLRKKALQPHNPRTKAQVHARSAFRLMQETLAPIRALFTLGFEAGERENGRRVSSYHMALGENLREAIKTDAQGNPTVDYRFLKISSGMHGLAGMRVVRGGANCLIITHAPLVDARYSELLVAVYNRRTGAWWCFKASADFSGARHVVEIPEAWIGDSLHVYVGAGSEKNGKRYHCESQHFELPAPPSTPATISFSTVSPKPLTCICRNFTLAPEGTTVVNRRGRYVLRR